MVLRHHYFTPATPGNPSSDTELTASLRLGTLAGLVAEASLLAVGSCGVEVDDTAAALDLVKHKTWYALQDAAPAGGAIAGTVSKTSGSKSVTGSGTAFTDLVAGQELTIPGGGGDDVVQVALVTSDTALTVTVAPTHTASGQTATLASRQRVWEGYTGDQTVSRGEEVHGSARHWSVDLADVNSLPGFRVIQSGDGSYDANHANRPAEGADDRLHWLLSVDYLTDTLWDEGLVNWAALALVSLDAADYTGQRPSDVLNEIMQASRLECFVRLHEATNHVELFLAWDYSPAGPGGRTLDAHTPGGAMRVSNVAAEVDASDPANQTTFAPEWPDATLQRGGDILAGVYGRDSAGHESYQTTAQTSYDFGWRDGVAQVPSAIKTQAKLDAYCQSVRDDSAEQTLVLRFRLLVRAAQLTCLQAGERFQAHLTHLPGLDTGFRWCRAIRVTISDAPGETQEAYLLDVEATPLPLPLTCSAAAAAAVPAHITDQASSTSPYSLSVTPSGGSSMVIAGFLAGGTGMSLSGVAEVNSVADTGHETAAIGWGVSSSPVTVSASYTNTGSIQAAAMAAIRTLATAPLQVKSVGWSWSPTATLDDPPTAGNLLVGVVVNSQNATPATLTIPGWARIAEGQANGVHPFGGNCVSIFARCSAGSDGTLNTGTSTYSLITLMEWPM